MKIIEHRALRGPNRYSRYPTIFLSLDLGPLEEKPSDKLPGFTETLLSLLPTLDQHGCSIGGPGGFVQRLKRGTWAGHIVEHVALELQCLSGMEVGFGKTFGTSNPGIYHVVYRYRAESAGLYAGRMAVDLVDTVIQGQLFNVEEVVSQLKEMREKDMLGPTTASIVAEAKSRKIPALRLNNESFVQLGYGVKQHRIQAAMTDRTSALGVEIADEKFRTKDLLERAGIPVPKGILAISLEEALQAADEIGYPVAVKPEVGNHGRGISTLVENPSTLEPAFVSAKNICRHVIVEKHLVGFDFRILVIDGHFAAAARREPAHVIGDGDSSIQELVDKINDDPRRGFGHERVLTRISVDKMAERLLALSGYKPNDILPRGEKLYLKSTANLSMGGTARDETECVHHDVRFMSERIAQIIGLDCIGIDIVAPRLDLPLDPTLGGIVEVNAAPGFRMHLFPTEGKPRNVAKPFVEMLFPPEKSFEVPLVAVTGTNGKTTTAKLIAHTLKYSGRTVGFAGTTGVEVDGVSIASGDFSGPEGARMVLSEPSIDDAVLEVARGGIVRRGLGFDEANVGVLLNIDEDHIGTDGVEDLEDLAKVKSTVIEVVKETGVSVLNADDPIVAGLNDVTKGRIIYFSINPENPIIRDHHQAGGTAVILEKGNVIVRSSEPDVLVLPIIDAPVTLRGIVTFNTLNVLAATAALIGLGTSMDVIRNGIRTFHPSATQNPGRMNLIDFKTFKVIVDYGHNVPAVRALGNVLPHISMGRKLVVAHGTGNRLDQHIEEFGAALAMIYDHIILADADPRARKTGETPNLVKTGAIRQGLSDTNLEIILDPIEAVDRAFEIVLPGDLIVIQVDEVEPMLNRVMQHFERLMGTKN